MSLETDNHISLFAITEVVKQAERLHAEIVSDLRARAQEVSRWKISPIGTEARRQIGWMASELARQPENNQR